MSKGGVKCKAHLCVLCMKGMDEEKQVGQSVKMRNDSCIQHNDKDTTFKLTLSTIVKHDIGFHDRAY